MRIDEYDDMEKKEMDKYKREIDGLLNRMEIDITKDTLEDIEDRFYKYMEKYHEQKNINPDEHWENFSYALLVYYPELEVDYYD